MRKDVREKYIYLGAAILFCVFLTVGLLSLMSGVDTKERRKAEPGKEPAEEEKTVETDIIRVVIKTNGFKAMEHESVTIQSESGMVLHYGSEERECGAGEAVAIAPNDGMFQGGTILAEPKDENGKITISSLKRGYGEPSYRGKLELYSTSNGVAVVNELLLEEYLYAVVPGEMPASYELEALKAQAVCARSYAAKQTRDYAYPEYNAHVDDSTLFQVYGNSLEMESAVQAVNETAGEKVWHGGEVATTYYFSTSCGQTTSAEAWGTAPSEANSYLKSVKVEGENGAYEAELPWHRWTAKIPEKLLSQLISANTQTNIGNLTSVEVTKRGPGDIVLQIVASGDQGSVTVETENKIRRALGGSGYTLQRQDGESTESRELLPSAFFTITKKDGVYIIEGGGFGHGIGMSQNGANEMAKEGKTYREILELFYQDIEVKK